MSLLASLGSRGGTSEGIWEAKLNREARTISRELHHFGVQSALHESLVAITVDGKRPRRRLPVRSCVWRRSHEGAERPSKRECSVSTAWGGVKLCFAHGL